MGHENYGHNFLVSPLINFIDINIQVEFNRKNIFNGLNADKATTRIYWGKGPNTGNSFDDHLEYLSGRATV